MEQPGWKPFKQFLKTLNIHFSKGKPFHPCLLKREESLCPYKDSHINIHSGLTSNRPTPETT